MPFNIIYGDITTLKYDAIVNPTNQYLIAGGGIDKEIQSLAGNPLLIERIKIGTLSMGHAAITNAYNMPCKKNNTRFIPRMDKRAARRRHFVGVLLHRSVTSCRRK